MHLRTLTLKLRTRHTETSRALTKLRCESKVSLRASSCVFEPSVALAPRSGMHDHAALILLVGVIAIVLVAVCSACANWRVVRGGSKQHLAVWAYVWAYIRI